MTTEDRHQIVVGVDGSHHARNALRWGVRLARVLADTVTALHGVGLVEHIGDALVPAHPHRAEVRETVEREWCGALARAGLPHRVEVIERPAVDALLAAVNQRPTDLVVVGTRGLRLAGAQALGSTALQLLRLAPVPVLVVPDPSDGRSVEARRLVVGFDGSEASFAALHWSAQLAARSGASCEVVAVAEETPVFPLGPGTTASSAGEEQAPSRLRGLAEEACAPLDAANVPHRVTVRRGQAAATLVAIARAHHADLIVVGSSGAGSRGDPLLGSVSRRVAHDADRPVAVIPGPGTDRRRTGSLVPAGVADRHS
ncbi:MAG TPA: universal stress protein [Acidimicrobiales bacterium]|nr:universal stress protein [Acidimicrobiales bacterium]